MSDKIRKEFEKWAKTKEGCDLSLAEDGEYSKHDVFVSWHAFQAAYDLREKEVQRLKEVVDSFIRCSYPVSKDIDSRGYRWCEGWLDAVLKQALQQTTKGVK